MSEKAFSARSTIDYLTALLHIRFHLLHFRRSTRTSQYVLDLPSQTNTLNNGEQVEWRHPLGPHYDELVRLHCKINSNGALQNEITANPW